MLMLILILQAGTMWKIFTQQYQTHAWSCECPLSQVMPTPKLYIQLINISTLFTTSSVRGFELQVKQFNETEN
jgi:hypothetical protein